MGCVVGPRSTHGVTYDFYHKLKTDPARLEILGDGRQRKSYLYVQDCLDAMLHVARLHTARDARHHTQVYNLGTPEYVQVNQSIGYLCAALGLKPPVVFPGADSIDGGRAAGRRWAALSRGRLPAARSRH